MTDLRALAQSDGALHGISSLVYRDWLVTVDTKEGKVVDDTQKRWSTTKLNNNELMLLLGLTVQADSANTYSVLPHKQDFLARTDRLLREFHDNLLANFMPQMDAHGVKFPEGPEVFGTVSSRRSPATPAPASYGRCVPTG